jgi:hypothetical protein
VQNSSSGATQRKRNDDDDHPVVISTRLFLSTYSFTISDMHNGSDMTDDVDDTYSLIDAAFGASEIRKVQPAHSVSSA